MGRRALQLLISLAGVALLTYAGYSLFPVNATTQGFAYLLLVLIIASIWGFFEASVTSVAATLTFNFFFCRRSEGSRSRIRKTGSLCSVS